MYITGQTINELLKLNQIKYNKAYNVFVARNGEYTIKPITNTYNQIYTYKVYKPKLNNDGYLYPGLALSKTKSMGRLVAETFIEIPKELKHLIGTRQLQVDHINNNRLDNRVENLQWLTQKENLKKRPPFKHKRYKTDLFVFDNGTCCLEFKTLKEAAEFFKTTSSSILTSINLINKYKGFTIERVNNADNK